LLNHVTHIASSFTTKVEKRRKELNKDHGHFSLSSFQRILFYSYFSLSAPTQLKHKSNLWLRNWNAVGTWVGGVVPGAVDDVIINNGHTVTLTDSRACNNLTINLENSTNSKLCFYSKWTTNISEVYRIIW